MQTHTARWALAALLVVTLSPACKSADPPRTHNGASPDGTPSGKSGAAPAPAKGPRVKISTTLGDFVVELFADKAPLSTKNFLRYVDEKFYDGTIFHRVMSDFMVQGGGFTESLEQKPTHEPIKNEADNGLSNARGTLAMARTPIVDSATAQWFVNVVDNQRLDHAGPGPRFGYAVFGKVVQGMDVVDKIRDTPVEQRGPQFTHLPSTTVVIKSARRL
jgi:cyclophilin family peptidyl-prolyl cis-trans isomerase